MIVKTFNETLQNVDPWASDLSPEIQEQLVEECRINPAFFFEVVCRPLTNNQEVKVTNFELIQAFDQLIKATGFIEGSDSYRKESFEASTKRALDEIKRKIKYDPLDFAIQQAIVKHDTLQSQLHFVMQKTGGLYSPVLVREKLLKATGGNK